MRKRLLSLALALVMVLSLLPMSAMAADSDFVIEDGVLVKYNGPGGDVVVPGDMGITAIGENAFSEFTINDKGWKTFKRTRYISSLIIPEGVTEIRDEAFSHCNLQSISLPQGLESIGESAFSNCSGLKEISLPSTVRYIETYAFFGCTELETVSLPENVYVIGVPFWECSNLTEVTIPDTAVSLNTSTIWGHETAAATPFPVTPYEEKFFERQKDSDFVMFGSTMLKYQGDGGDVVLPKQTRIIAASAWDSADNITSITYPKEMTAWLNEHLDEGGRIGVHFERQYFWMTAYYEFKDLKTPLQFYNVPLHVSVSPADAVGRVRVSSYDYPAWKNYVTNQRLYNLPVDPSKCLGKPSDRVAAKSNDIVSAAGATTDYEKARAIADWVAKNVKYDWDVSKKKKFSEDAVIDPEQILNGAVTICDGYTQLTNQLLWAQGIPANRIVGKGDNGDHAWTEAWIKDEGRWIIIDTTWMAPFISGTQEQGYDPDYFDVGILYFSLKHLIEERPYAQVPKMIAYPSTQMVDMDGKRVEFQCYALKDAKGNDTNYVKLRDIAQVFSGTAAQFDVGWTNVVTIETGKAYTPNGSEMKTPFSGQRVYERNEKTTMLDGRWSSLVDSIILKDDNGGAYTYYKLRDLGAVLGAKVGWSAEKGIYIETK